MTMTKHSKLLAFAIAAVSSIALSSAAFADSPAVSAVNGKVSLEGGNFDGKSGQAVQGTIAAPLGNAFGLQFDTAFGNIGPMMDLYRPYVDGLENLPRDGRFLLVGNHTQGGGEVFLIPYFVRQEIGCGPWPSGRWARCRRR